jgi:hypothetical protein
MKKCPGCGAIMKIGECGVYYCEYCGKVIHLSEMNKVLDVEKKIDANNEETATQAVIKDLLRCIRFYTKIKEEDGNNGF